MKKTVLKLAAKAAYATAKRLAIQRLSMECISQKHLKKQ